MAGSPVRVDDRRRLGRPEAPLSPRRQVAADRYWQLRHLVSEALRARDRASYAQAAHLAAQAKVDTLLASIGLDPSQAYEFNDAALTLTPAAPPAPPVPSVESGARSPLSMLDDE